MPTRKTLPTNLPSRYIDAGKTPLQGGYGTARVLQDQWLDRKVLLKTIHDPQALMQLEIEYQTIATIRSKHVVALFDVLRTLQGTIDGLIYEYLPGKSPEPASFPPTCELTEFLKVLYQIASGLADIHQAKIVHRDLKLANVKRDAEGILKIFDFGISSNFGDITTAARGTRFYLGPELFASNRKTESTLDLYAFGACCWALITHNVPSCLFELPPQSKGKVPSIKSARTDLPDDLVALIDNCLSIDPKCRPSAIQIKELLHKHLVKGRHRAVLIGLSELKELSKDNRAISLKVESVGELRIEYNLHDFVVTSATGEVFLNNHPVIVGQILYDACLLTFGAVERGAFRSYIDLSASHPEVVL